MKTNWRIRSKITNNQLKNLAFILFMSYRCWYGILRLGRSSVTMLASMVLIYAIVFVSALMSKESLKAVFYGIAVVSICAGIFLITYLAHPDYGTWFFHNADYGLFVNVFKPTDGLYSFLFICLCLRSKDLRRNMRIVAYALLIYAVYQLVPVIRTGHWNNIARTGLRVNQSSYSLGFGYRTVFCAIVFWYEFKQTKKIYYMGLSLVTLVMVLRFGGRGCFLVFLIYIALTNFLKVSTSNRKKIIIALLVSVLLLLWFSGLLSMFAEWIEGAISGVTSSRTLSKLVEGEFFEDQARLRIWEMSFDLIKTGGINGRGAYGDRLTIGQYFSWGYSHNVILEMLVSFGVWGAMFILLLIIGIIKYIKNPPSMEWRDIFLVYLSWSMQLLVSDSFWYNTAFWSVLALLFSKRLQRINVQKNWRLKIDTLPEKEAA